MGICETNVKNPNTIASNESNGKNPSTFISNESLDNINEKQNNSPISVKEMNELFTYGSAVCKILVNKAGKNLKGTGFFCEINEDNFPFKKALFTNNHVLNKSYIEKNKIIEIEYLKEKKIIEITNIRKYFNSEEYDYTCIEIFDTDKI